MKHYIASLIFATGAILSSAAMAAEQEVELRVENMQCPACPMIVKSTLEDVDGVSNADVHYLEGIAVVTFDSDVTTEDALVAAAARAGYLTMPRQERFRTIQ